MDEEIRTKNAKREREREGKRRRKERRMEMVETTLFPKTHPMVKDKRLARTNSPSAFAKALSNPFTNRRAACQVTKKHAIGV